MPSAPCSPVVAQSRTGFTLVEVIVVLAVVLLLTGIAVPMISGYMEDGRRARATAEVKVVAAAVASFYKDVGVYPSRNSSGASNSMSLLLTGPTRPGSNPWTAGHQFATWSLNSAASDLLDNHLLVNRPGGQAGGAYPTTGANRWRGPYLAGSSPLDPWGRPYVINVVSGYSVHATNHKRMFVMSAGPDGNFDTDYRAMATTDLGGDDLGVIVHVRP